MRRIRRFWSNDWARIPFSIIGFFLMLGSSMTTVYIMQLEREKAKEISWTIETNDLEPVVCYVEADLARCLNYAACMAFEEIGKNPVVVPVADTVLYTDVNNDGRITGVDVNINRMRFESYRHLQRMVLENFQNNRYVSGDYQVTVTIPESWDEITLEKNIITMELERFLDSPLLSCNTTYPVYPVLRVNMSILVNDTVLGKTVFDKQSVIMTIITNRYLLLEELTNEFDYRINGTWSSFGVNSLIYAMPLTWIHGWAQHITDKPLNIISTKWLEVITNSALLLEEGFVFNSVDPLGVVYTGYETVRAIAQDFGVTLDVGVLKNHLRSQVNSPMETNDLQQRHDQIVQTPEFAEVEVLGEDQLRFSPEMNISKICRQEAESILGDPDGLLTRSVLDVYSADVYTNVTRETYEDNQVSINNARDAEYDNEVPERSRTSEAISMALSEMSCAGCGNWTFNGVSFQGMYTSGISSDVSSLVLQEAVFQHVFLFDNTVRPVILGGESWTNHRTQTQEYSWSSYSTWSASWSNDNSSCGSCSLVVTLPSIPRGYTGYYYDRQWVNITFESNHFSEYAGTFNDIVNPFNDTVFDDHVDPNLGWVYKRDPKVGSWLVLDRYQLDVVWPDDMLWSCEPRKEFLRDGSGSGFLSKSYPVEINPDRYQYQFLMYPDWIYSKITSVITDWMVRIPCVVNASETVDNSTVPDELESSITASLVTDWNTYRSGWDSEVSGLYTSGDWYTCAAAKVLYTVVMRYLDAVEDRVVDLGSEQDIKKSIDDAFQQAGVESSYDEMMDDVSAAENLTSGLPSSFPLSCVVNLNRSASVDNPLYGGWSERFQCAVVQDPSFFSKEQYGEYYSGSSEQKCSLRYQNINVFSPGAGLSSLLDQGFDAVNSMVMQGLDTGFSKLDEVAVAGGAQVRSEVKLALDNITDQIYDDLVANLSKNITKALGDSVTVQHLNVSVDVLCVDDIVFDVLYESRYPGHMRNNSHFASDLNSSVLVDRIGQRLQQRIDAEYGYYSDALKESIMNVLDEQVLSRFSYVVSQTINSSKELLKDEYGKLSSKLQKWGNDQLSKLVSRFIPTGLPLLPYIGWVITLNVWYIDVSGQIPYFQVVDTFDETQAHPFWGHTAQEYTRQHNPVYMKIIVDGIERDLYIGKNIPVDFEYKTATLVIVPPNKVTGMGDRIGGWDETSAYP